MNPVRREKTAISTARARLAVLNSQGSIAFGAGGDGRKGSASAPARQKELLASTSHEANGAYMKDFKSAMVAMDGAHSSSSSVRGHANGNSATRMVTSKRGRNAIGTSESGRDDPPDDRMRVTGAGAAVVQGGPGRDRQARTCRAGREADVADAWGSRGRGGAREQGSGDDAAVADDGDDCSRGYGDGGEDARRGSASLGVYGGGADKGRKDRGRYHSGNMGANEDADNIETLNVRGKSSNGAERGRYRSHGGGSGGGTPYPAVIKPAKAWWTGPADEQGQLVDVSDRPLLCSSSSGGGGGGDSGRFLRGLGTEVVFGGADHALYGVEMETGNVTRTFFSKSSGHSEWVTCVTHCAPSGRIVSGGMDGRLCLWPALGGGGESCAQVNAHAGFSISQLRADTTDKVISGGYDGELKLWDTRNGQLAQIGSMACQGHSVPVMDFCWSESGVYSGYRDGSVYCWDVATTTVVGWAANAHDGHVTVTVPRGRGKATEAASAQEEEDGGHLLTGGQDGLVKVWDRRSGLSSCVVAVAAHRSPGTGVGAIGGILTLGSYGLVSYGADKRICRMDLRKASQGSGLGLRLGEGAHAHTQQDYRGGQSAVVKVFDEHRDFIYSAKLVGGLLLTGGGDGVLLVHDLAKGRLLYGLGCCRGAVRAIEATATRLMVGGDDGKALLHDFDYGFRERGGRDRDDDGGGGWRV